MKAASKDWSQTSTVTKLPHEVVHGSHREFEPQKRRKFCSYYKSTDSYTSFPVKEGVLRSEGGKLGSLHIH